MISVQTTPAELKGSFLFLLITRDSRRGFYSKQNPHLTSKLSYLYFPLGQVVSQDYAVSVNRRKWKGRKDLPRTKEIRRLSDGALWGGGYLGHLGPYRAGDPQTPPQDL